MSPAGDGLLLSVSFWVAFALYLLLDRVATGLLPGRLHHLATTLASTAFLWFFTGIGAGYLGALLAGLALVYGAARRALAGPTRGRAPGRLALLLGLVIVAWALGKIGASLDLSHLAWLFFLGVSFLLVKIWTFCKDLYDGRIPDPRLEVFLNYCTFFPCFLSGPMHTYAEFRSAFEERSPVDATSALELVFRILHGMVKVLILAAVLRPLSLEGIAGAGSSEVAAADLVLRSVVYSLVIYLDFSGYSDIAIASGGILGVRVPENFNLPYLARNLREFWQRWHITFTRFLTQYLFVPFTRAFRARWPGASPIVLSSTAYLATFLFCGFWHGSTGNFLLWGAYHGVGLAGYDWFRQRRVAIHRAAGRPPPRPGPALRALFVATTFLFVSLGWVLFTLPLDFWVR